MKQNKWHWSVSYSIFCFYSQISETGQFTWKKLLWPTILVLISVLHEVKKKALLHHNMAQDITWWLRQSKCASSVSFPLLLKLSKCPYKHQTLKAPNLDYPWPPLQIITNMNFGVKLWKYQLWEQPFQPSQWKYFPGIRPTDWMWTDVVEKEIGSPNRNHQEGGRKTRKLCALVFLGYYYIYSWGQRKARWSGTSQVRMDHRAWASILVLWRRPEGFEMSLGQTSGLDRLFRLQYREARSRGTARMKKTECPVLWPSRDPFSVPMGTRPCLASALLPPLGYLR